MRTMLDEVLEESFHKTSCNCHSCNKIRQNEVLYLNEFFEDGWNNELSSLQLNSAVEYNRKNAQSVGWLNYYDAIVEKILRLNYSPDELEFAKFVANWQSNNGFSGKDIDGKIGRKTWGLMKRLLALASTSNISTNNSNIDRIPSMELTWHPSDPYPRSFMENVYNKAVNNGKKSGRTFSPSLPSSQISSVGNGKYLRKDAAAALNQLLQKVNIDAYKNKQKFTISSGYRSADEQFRLWNKRFKDYYKRAINERVIGVNDYGEASANALAKFIGSKTAAPGYSNHQNGLAVDFSVITSDGKPLTKNSTLSAHLSNWKKTWFWGWLNKNASSFGFCPYLKEPWHWEFRGNSPCHSTR